MATASTAEKLAVARSHGAGHSVIFPSATALDELRAILPRGAEVVFDPIGGDAFDLSMRCVANSGRILVIGFAGGRIQQIPANIILVKNAFPFLEMNFGSYTGWTRDTSRYRTHGAEMHGVMDQIFALYRQGKIRPSHIAPISTCRFSVTRWRRC